MAVKDFVVKNGLQVTSNVLVGSYVNTVASSTVQNGMAVSGNVGIGTSTVTAGSRMEVIGGNARIGTNGFGLVFPDGSFQASAATSTAAAGGTGAIQYANSTAFAGDNTKFYYDSTNYRVGIGTNDVSAATLHVAGSLPALFNTASGSDPQIRIGNAATTAATLGYNTTGVYGYLRAAPGGSDMINWKEGAVGINGVTAPINALDVSGGAVIGSGGAYAGGATAPTDGLLVQGAVGLGTTATGTNVKLDVWEGNLRVATSGYGIVFSNGSFQTVAFNSSSAVTSFSAGTTGLTPNTGTTGAITLGGTLGAGNGGTGQSSYAVGDLLYASGATALSKLGAELTGNVLISGGAATAPAWGKVGLTTHVSGTLPVANGGTNSSSASGTALDNITGFNGTGIMRRTGAGTYTFGTAVDLTTEVTNTLPATNGGTGQNAVATGDLLYGSNTNTWSRLASVATGNVLISGGVTTAPSWGKVDLTTTVTGVLPLANGGTNKAISVSNGGIVWTDSDSMEVLAASATSGNVLISGGAGTPSWGQYYTNTNVPSSIVSRDGSGNFSAGTITAATGLTVSAGGFNVTGYSQITGNLNITGNLVVSGNINTINSNVLVVNDPIIYVGDNNPGNTWDLGLVAAYTTDIYRHTGLLRNKTDGVWTFFDNLITEPGDTINWDQVGLSYPEVKMGSLNVAVSTNSTSTTTGAIITAGGVGMAGNLNVGGSNSIFGGDVAINGGDITTSSSTATVFNATATTLSVGQSATTLNIGANTGTLTIGNPTVVGTQSTQSLYNTVATTVNFAGAATAINMGANSGTLTVGNPTVVGTQSTQALYNTVATTINFGGAGTQINIGAATGETKFAHNANVAATTASTDTTNGALRVLGGAGIAGNVNVGGTHSFFSGGAVGVGTSTLSATTSALEAWTGNIKIGSASTGLVFPDGTFQTTAFSSAGVVTSFSAGTTGLTPNTGTTGAVTLSGTLVAANGGTGQSSYAVGDLLYASGATALSKLGAELTGNVLISGGATTAPAWGKVGLTTHVDGTLGATNGGTGQSTVTTGDLLYGSNTNTWSKLAGVATGNVLISGGVATAPSWGKVDLSTTVTGVLPLTNGGTNKNLAASNGGIVWTDADSMEVLSASATSGNVLISGGAGTPSWGQYYTNTNVPSSIVSRDANGSFAGNVVTANTITMTYTVDVTGTYTTGASTSQVTIDTFAGDTYRAAEYQISMKAGTDYAISRVTVIHDGATAYLTEYDAANTNGFLVDFDANYNAGTIELKAAPRSATVTEFKISRKMWVV